jgi:1-deoxy-D-xylulose-5-phosphate synthase
METEETKFLQFINDARDLRKLDVSSLRTVCAEVRSFLVDSVSKTGGHLGAGLGAVELTVALHYVFNTPDDKLVWDTGHQAYPHKILTGRKDRLHSIRQLNGLSGFLRRDESEFDTFGAGHANTAISAALGMAAARDFAKKDYKVVAIVGDGSLTGGMAYEGLNNAGVLKKDMIVVLSDNKMVSLSANNPTLWSLHNYFSEALTHPTYNKFKANVWDLTGKLDTFGDRLRSVAGKLERGVKAVVTPGMMFEAMGFRYFGPFNGHNVVKLVEILQHVKELKGPILLHLNTEKGKGYVPAEKDAAKLHGVTPFDKETGLSPKSSAPAAYTKIFGNALLEICRSNPKVVGITAAMPDGTGLDILQQSMPERFFDVGIAEQHAVTFAAGMATEGYIPVVAIYSTFLQRAFDQIIHDVSLQDLHVVFVLDRAGLVGADGPTHHGALDLSYLRCIPNMIIMAPKDENELRDMLYTAVELKNCPVAIRYPRGNCFGHPLNPSMSKIPVGTSETVRSGQDVAILAVGTMVTQALKAAELLEKDGILAEVVNMRFIKPLDVKALEDIANRFTHIITVEENSIIGGFGTAVLETLAALKKTNVAVKIHGLTDGYVTQGTPAELLKITALDGQGIADTVKEFYKSQHQPTIVPGRKAQ